MDPEYIQEVCRKPAVQARVKELEETFAGRKILLGVDRLDYIKGMPHKLLGLELFLARYPEWRGRVTLIQIGVPSRAGVPEYQKLGQQVNELVGRINGAHGTLDYSPIHYINQSVPQDELFAIYKVADVCLVTSVRDGMNLVSHEYVIAQSPESSNSSSLSSSSTTTSSSSASALSSSSSSSSSSDIISEGTSLLSSMAGQGDAGSGDGTGGDSGNAPGVLVLSEFAGSAQSLSGAIRVNPWNTEELATAIHTSLTLSPVERELRHQKLYRYVSSHTAANWATTLMSEFREIKQLAPNVENRPKKLNMKLARR